MENSINFKKDEGKLLLEILQQNMYFLNLAGQRQEQNQVRLKLLQDILGGMECSKKDELTQQIYLYGSMVRKQDLMARQLFLWLLEIVEQREQ